MAEALRISFPLFRKRKQTSDGMKEAPSALREELAARGKAVTNIPGHNFYLLTDNPLPQETITWREAQDHSRIFSGKIHAQISHKPFIDERAAD